MKLTDGASKTEINIMRILFIILIISSFSLISCENDIPFDSEKWLITDHVEYPYRDAMVNDLLQNYLYKGARFSDISPLLGEYIRLTGADESTSARYYEVDIVNHDRRTYLYVKLNSNGDVEKSELVKWPEILRKKH